MISKTGEAETITSHYLFALGAYRGLYIFNWVYRYYFEGFYDFIAIVAGCVQTILYCDFFYLYITKGKMTNVSQIEVISKTKSESTLNHILIVAKFHIYSYNYDKTHPNLQRFITLKDKISTEKYIAYASHTEESFKKSGNL